MKHSEIASIEEAYAIVKKRYDDINGVGGVETFDPAIIPLIKYLNGLTGVTTAYCCEGHFKEGKKLTQGYVMMAVTGTGLDQLNNLMRRMVKGLSGQLAFDVELASKVRFLPVGRTERPYMSQVLRMTFRSPEHKETFYKELYEMLGIAK
jgi:hypothetical protein